MHKLKEQLHALCILHVQERLQNAQQGINEARASSANETKSSAGDKYETARAMAQQEIDRNTLLLAEAQQLLNTLNRINILSYTGSVIPGSLVKTDKANFYVAISAGTISVEGEKYFAISPASPIGLKLSGKKAGEEFGMNGVKYIVKEVL